MRRLLAFILLISHMNTSMFLPQAPEVDVYDTNGNQLDDITSIVELVRVQLGYDHHADDENDDSGQNFHIVNFYEYTFQPFFTEEKNETLLEKETRFHNLDESKTLSISYDILVPPPKI
ncbi:MAG: hypothetical protein ABI237_07245 [Ginsengibacter sp.]